MLLLAVTVVCKLGETLLLILFDFVVNVALFITSVSDAVGERLAVAGVSVGLVLEVADWVQVNTHVGVASVDGLIVSTQVSVGDFVVDVVPVTLVLEVADWVQVNARVGVATVDGLIVNTWVGVGDFVVDAVGKVFDITAVPVALVLEVADWVQVNERVGVATVDGLIVDTQVSVGDFVMDAVGKVFDITAVSVALMLEVADWVFINVCVGVTNIDGLIVRECVAVGGGAGVVGAGVVVVGPGGIGNVCAKLR